ncbi:MAG: hypothetical protein IH937_09695 [Acidobacteria bacterium]|nr:hypothetical protein [Acidobacteriota bacterium]
MNKDYLIAVDFHCKYQKVDWVNRATGETGEADLEHADLEKLCQWYKAFRPGTVVEMEASGHGWWFAVDPGSRPGTAGGTPGTPALLCDGASGWSGPGCCCG